MGRYDSLHAEAELRAQEVEEQKGAPEGNKVSVEGLRLVHEVRAARLSWCRAEAGIEPDLRAVQNAPLIRINRELGELRQAFAATVAGVPAEWVRSHEDFHHLGGEDGPGKIEVIGRA